MPPRALALCPTGSWFQDPKPKGFLYISDLKNRQSIASGDNFGRQRKEKLKNPPRPSLENFLKFTPSARAENARQCWEILLWNICLPTLLPLSKLPLKPRPSKKFQKTWKNRRRWIGCWRAMSVSAKPR